VLGARTRIITSRFLHGAALAGLPVALLMEPNGACPHAFTRNVVAGQPLIPVAPDAVRVHDLALPLLAMAISDLGERVLAICATIRWLCFDSPGAMLISRTAAH